MTKPLRLAIYSALALTAVFSNAWAVPGSPDTFDGGSLFNWTAGGFNPGGPQFPPDPPANIASGGPAGVGDSYLRVTSNGLVGPGGKMTVFNFTQWTGDFSNLSAINMDVNNEGATDLELRLFFGTFDLSQLAASTASVSVGAGSGWQNISLSLVPGDLTGFVGDVADTLANVQFLRIYHSAALLPPGNNLGGGAPAIAAQLGLDNISAVPIPPALALFVPALAGLWARTRRR